MSAPSEEELYMEEMVVIGNSFERIPLDPAEFSVSHIQQMRGSRRHANELFGDGHYDDAYPLLLELAKRGFRDSQSRLAYILFNGTERVKKSNLRALGWLASAAYGDSEPKFRVLFKRYMDEVPDSVRPTVDEVIARYQESFAFDEHQNCSTEHPFAYGVVKRTYCRFKLETIAGRLYRKMLRSRSERRNSIGSSRSLLNARERAGMYAHQLTVSSSHISSPVISF